MSLDTAKRKALEERLRKSPQFSNRRIAEGVGVSHVTVKNYRHRLGLAQGFTRGRDKINRAPPLPPGLGRDLRDALANLMRQIDRVGQLQPPYKGAARNFYDANDSPKEERIEARLVARYREYQELRNMAAAGMKQLNEQLASVLNPEESYSLSAWRGRMQRLTSEGKDVTS